MEFFTLILTIVALAVSYYFMTKRPKNFPPGPRGVPIFGNVFQLGEKAHISEMELSKKYGKILGLQMGSYRAVMLLDGNDIREAFSKPEFTGRFGYNAIMDTNYGTWNIGVILSEGQFWQDLRRFSLKGLRDHGLGKRSMESIIQEEAQELIQELKGKVGESISTELIFNPSVLNVIWSIITGSRFSLDDPKLAELLHLLVDFMKNSTTGLRLLNFIFPLAVDIRKQLPFLFPKTNEVFRDKIFAMLGQTIQEHRETIEIGNPRDFIDTYLEETMKTNDPNSPFKSNDEDLRLIVLLIDFFIAGSDTTSNTLTWSLFLLALNPVKQEKMANEIQSIVGVDTRQVQLEDRLNLPYTEATVSEIMRMSSIIAQTFAHSTTKDVSFKGFDIPKHTLVFANLYAGHYDPEIWGDPFVFRPERFLSKDETVFTRSPNLIPFGVGKRQCIGESLARDEFFIFLTNLVQQFKFTFPANEPQHSIQGPPGLVLMPEPHNIILLDRNST